jgi:hypothetical protein
MAEIVVALSRPGKLTGLQMGLRPEMFTASSVKRLGPTRVMFPKDAFIGVAQWRRNHSFNPANANKPEWTYVVQRRFSRFLQLDSTRFNVRQRAITINDKVINVSASGGSRSVDLTGNQGRGKIQNVVVVDNYPTNLPVSSTVMVIRLRDKKVVAITNSNSATGQYSVKGLNVGERYATVAFHHLDTYLPAVDINVRAALDND